MLVSVAGKWGDTFRTETRPSYTHLVTGSPLTIHPPWEHKQASTRAEKVYGQSGFPPGLTALSLAFWSF